MMQAQLQLQLKQPDQAESSLNRVIELDKNNVGALALLAQLQTARNQDEKAVANYQTAISLSPNNARLYIAIGAVYEKMGNWQQAQTSYQKALSLQPEDAMAANNLAYIMLEHGGSVNVALTLAQAARKGLPGLPNSADTLGWAYYNNGAYSVAAPLFEDAVKKVPENQTYRLHLGLTYKKLNDATRAKAEFEKVINLDPKSSIADQARRALSETAGS
jgi:tetratricopeptide (TPR) repeat protein